MVPVSMTLTVYGVGTLVPVVHLDFVITKARFGHGIKIATEVATTPGALS